MNGRRIAGIVLVLVFALPGLIAGTMLMGVSRPIVHDWFSQKRAKRIVDRLPRSMDNILKAASDPSEIQDPQVRAWAKALAEARPTPTEAAKRAGVFKWAREAIPTLFATIRAMLRGDRPVESVFLDLRGLKQALKSPPAVACLRTALTRLPPCNEAQRYQWRAAATGPRVHKVPACFPGDQEVEIAVKVLLAKIDAIPDKKEILHVEGDTRTRIDAVRALDAASWVVLLGALVLLFLGAVLAGSSPASMARWAGIPAMVGSLPALLMGLAMSGMMRAAANPTHWHIHSDEPFFQTELGRVVAKEVFWYVGQLFGDLFSTLTHVGLAVGGVGLALLVVSFFLPSSRE